MAKSSSLSLGAEIWARRGRDIISRRLFNLVYMASTLYALVVSAYASTFSSSWVLATVDAAGESHTTAAFWWLFVGTLVGGLIGVIISSASDDPIISFGGLTILAVAFGLMLGPVVAQYTATSVLKVLFITGGLVGVLAVMGVVIPESLEGWRGFLFGGLIVLLIGQFGIPLAGWLIPGFPIEGALRLWDWVGIALFSAYVIYDVNRAQRVQATYDNAVDCAVALYLDIINLFIRLLQIFGVAKDK